MMSNLESRAREAIEQGKGALGMLVSAERTDAEQLLDLCESHFLSEERSGSPAAPDSDDRKRAARLVELLARRSAAAMPFAALGRALLASWAGDEKQTELLLDEFSMKLSLQGL